MRIHYGVDSAAVTFPHGSESRLASNVPYLHGYPSFRHFSHIETNGWNHIICKLTSLKWKFYQQFMHKSVYRKDADESGLSRVLETNQGHLHLFIVKEAFDPI